MLDDVAEVIGEAAALDLAFEFRGLRLYVPKDPAREPEIARAIGAELAAKFCNVFGGETLSLPMREAIRRRVHQLRHIEKWTCHQIAKELKVTERQVYALLKKPPRAMRVKGDSPVDDRQMSLL